MTAALVACFILFNLFFLGSFYRLYWFREAIYGHTYFLIDRPDGIEELRKMIIRGHIQFLSRESNEFWTNPRLFYGVIPIDECIRIEELERYRTFSACECACLGFNI